MDGLIISLLYEDVMAVLKWHVNHGYSSMRAVIFLIRKSHSTVVVVDSCLTVLSFLSCTAVTEGLTTAGIVFIVVIIVVALLVIAASVSGCVICYWWGHRRKSSVPINDFESDSNIELPPGELTHTTPIETAFKQPSHCLTMQSLCEILK